jgi:hypothetical protein
MHREPRVWVFRNQIQCVVQQWNSSISHSVNRHPICEPCRKRNLRRYIVDCSCRADGNRGEIFLFAQEELVNRQPALRIASISSASAGACGRPRLPLVPLSKKRVIPVDRKIAAMPFCHLFCKSTNPVRFSRGIDKVHSAEASGSFRPAVLEASG